MPVLTANGLAVGASWVLPFGQNPFSAPYTALDVFVNGTDVVAQIAESTDLSDFVEDPSNEILLRGDANIVTFQSRPLPSFYLIRFKVYAGTDLDDSGTIDVTLRSD